MIAEPLKESRIELMRDLSSKFPPWGVWKSLDRTVAGQGDIDAVAPAALWGEIGAVFERWAFARGFEGVVGCRHVPGVLLLMAIQRDEPSLSELDLCDTFYWRGGKLANATELASLLIEGRHGIRRFRHGAEGLFLLALNGLRRGGRANLRSVRDQRVAELLKADPEGVDAAASTLGRVGPAIRALATAVADGRWDRASAMRAEAIGIVNAMTQPFELGHRVWFRLHADRSCPIVAATREGTRGRDEIERWLAAPTPFHSLARA